MGSPPTKVPSPSTWQPGGLQNAAAFREIVISPSADPNDLATATSLTSGTGVPTHTRGDGSEYWDNTTGYKYRRASGVWVVDSGGGIEIVANASGAPMVKGALVYPSSHDGTNWVVTLATNVDVDSRAVWVLTEAIADGTTGAAAGVATVTGLNTSAYSLAGVKLYLDTAGALVEAVPTGPTVIVQECAEVKVKSATVGELSYYPALAMLQGIEVSDLMGVTATAAELNYNDLTGAVGTVEASKAVVVDANKDISEFRNIGAALLTRDSNNLNISTTTTGSVEVDGIDGVAIESSSGPLTIGGDAAVEAVNIATGAAARVITLGNAASASLAMEAGVGGATLNADTTIALDAGGALAGAIVIDASNAAGGIDIDAGTGGIAIDTDGVLSLAGVGNSDVTVDAGDMNLATTTTGSIELDGVDGVNIESSAGVIRIGADNVAQNVAIASAGARIVSVGNAAAASLTLDGGVDAVTINADTHVDITAEVKFSAAGGADPAAALLGGVGTYANPATTAVAGSNMFEFRTQTTATADDFRGFRLDADFAGIGVSGDAIRGRGLVTAAGTAGTVDGGAFTLEYNGGQVAGQGTGLRGNLVLPNAALAGGTVYGTIAEIYAGGANSDAGGATKHAILGILSTGDGAGADRTMNAIEILGNTDGSGYMIYSHDHAPGNAAGSARCLINGAVRFLKFWAAE